MSSFLVNHSVPTQKAVDLVNRIYGPPGLTSSDQAKLEIVELSHSTAEGHEMIEAHKLLLCLAQHFAASLKEYQVCPRAHTHPRTHAHARTHTHTQARARSMQRCASSATADTDRELAAAFCCWGAAVCVLVLRRTPRRS
jgi:hypothetical protein